MYKPSKGVPTCHRAVEKVRSAHVAFSGISRQVDFLDSLKNLFICRDTGVVSLDWMTGMSNYNVSAYFRVHPMFLLWHSAERVRPSVTPFVRRAKAMTPLDFIFFAIPLHKPFSLRGSLQLLWSRNGREIHSEEPIHVATLSQNFPVLAVPYCTRRTKLTVTRSNHFSYVELNET